MKRRREMGEGSEIKSAIGELSMMIKLGPEEGRHDHSHPLIPIRPFLCVCNLVIEVLDKIGPTMAVLRQDIDQNVKTLELIHDSNPLLYSNAVEILKKESNEGSARKGTSCSRAFVWLTRSLDFAVALLRRISKDPDKNLDEAVEESYNTTLKPWHRWISSAAFKIALKLVPNNKSFIDILKPKDESYETLREDILAFIQLMAPFLEEIHSILKSYRLDKLKAS